MIDSKLTSAIELFHAASDAVSAVLAANSNWGASGVRDGQYAVDLDADAVCIDVLHAAGFRVLSEESGITGDPGTANAPIVVVDPLDGSTNASRQVPWYATALCLVDDDGPAAAMVANHATRERFAAIRGGGAHRDGETIAPSTVTELRHALIGLSGLPTHHYGWAQYRTMGASAPDICMVACGVTDAWADTGSYHGVWDYLASVLILTEAGGVATEVSGLDLCVLDHHARRGPVVAATAELLDQILVERRRGVVR
ncbi:MAG TPA: inositol monophosphatase [Ilumatobacter sp.]|nr:inositol monophosphatase [Ilumatobacter sp.]